MGVELSTNDVEVGPAAGRDAWDRLGHIWHLLAGGTLVVPTAIVLFVEDVSRTERVSVAALAVGFGLWHWFLLVRPRTWVPLSGPVILYWFGATAFTALLVNVDGAYSILLYGLYPIAFMTLDWWGMVPVIALTALVAVVQGLGSGGILNVLATAGLALVIGLVVHSVARQSEERQLTLEALEATRAELAESSRRTGVLEERQRLARELHDTVAQAFTSVVTHLEAAEQAIAEHPDTARSHLDTARRTAREGLTEIRRSVQALRPDLLEAASLAQALERTATRWSTEQSVPVDVRVTGEAVDLAPDTEAALLRLTQEALTNIGRHARATRVVVTLSYLSDTVTLDIDDDGAGFHLAPGRGLPADGGRHGGFGLIGMRERIEAVGGHLDIESAPGEGTTVAVSVRA